MFRALILSLALAFPAGAFELKWPVDCVLGDTCRIQNYFDRDPGPGSRDFTCGPLTYDGHDGTDIALPNVAAMQAGVQVLAAAPGTVLGTRDGVADFLPPTEGKECGNGVLVDAGNGWQTQYCHMKQGSVAVRQGDRVVAGTPLGLVGQSGMAEFPHLHLSVRQGGTPVDPFAPDQTTCGRPSGPGLWSDILPYEAGGFLAAGFASEVPSFAAIKAGLATPPLPTNTPALVLWAEVFGGQAGDVVEFAISGPDGAFFLSNSALDKTQALLFRAAGKKLASPLPPGQYFGVIRLLRKDREVDLIETRVTVR